MALNALHDALVQVSRVERRLEPFFRAPLDALLRGPQAAVIQFLINAGRTRDVPGLAQERPIPDEEAHIQSIIDTMRAPKPPRRAVEATTMFDNSTMSGEKRRQYRNATTQPFCSAMTDGRPASRREICPGSAGR